MLNTLNIHSLTPYRTYKPGIVASIIQMNKLGCRKAKYCTSCLIASMVELEREVLSPGTVLLATPYTGYIMGVVDKAEWKEEPLGIWLGGVAVIQD